MAHNNLYSSIENYTKGKINRLKRDIEVKIDEELDKFGRDITNKLKEYVSKWYNSYDPLDYQRTNDLINSITYTIKNKRVEVKFDMRKFHTGKVNNGKGWQPHRGFDGIKFTWGLIDWIENGGNGGIKTNPRKYDGGIHMIEDTEKWLQDYIDKEVQKIIKIVIRDNYKKDI